MFKRQTCQIEGCKPYPATKTKRARMRSGLVARVYLCDMHHAMNAGEMQMMAGSERPPKPLGYREPVLTPCSSSKPLPLYIEPVVRDYDTGIGL